jgi:hypothetical protein
MQSVRQALWMLRQRVADGCVVGSDPIEVDPAVIETDAWRMTMLVAEGRLDDAAAMWGGAWLTGLELPECKAWDEWADRQRLRIDTLLADALHSAATDGPAERAEPRLQLAVRIEPHNPRHAIALAEVLLDRQRPEAASRLLAELRQQETVDVQSEAVSALERRARDALRAKSAEADAFLMRPPFADRVGELAEMARLWRRTKDGATSRVLLRGQTGVGRSRLCQELAAMVRSDRCRVVRVVATESDASLELGVVASLARELLGLSGARGVTVASDAVLRSLLPSLSAAPAESGPHPTAYADAVMDLVSAVAYEGPLLIVFEDTQWLDAASRSVLVRLARQVEREPVMFVATVSTDHPTSESERVLEELRRQTAIEVITLRGLVPQRSTGCRRHWTVHPPKRWPISRRGCTPPRPATRAGPLAASARWSKRARSARSVRAGGCCRSGCPRCCRFRRFGPAGASVACAGPWWLSSRSCSLRR